MSWRQIPYPPERPALPSSGHSIEIGDERLRIAVDAQTGLWTSLTSATADVDFLPGPGAHGTFRLYSSDGSWLLGQTVCASEVRKVSDSRIEIVYDRPRSNGLLFPVRLTLILEVTDDPAWGPSLSCHHEAEHTGDRVMPGARQVYSGRTGILNLANREHLNILISENILRNSTACR